SGACPSCCTRRHDPTRGSPRMRGKLRRMRTDVVVAGAGMAGLACALDLRDAGLDVVVLEAGHRPGGRVRTVTFDDGRWVETGGEWIDTAHANVHELLGRYGLRDRRRAPVVGPG